MPVRSLVAGASGLVGSFVLEAAKRHGPAVGVARSRTSQVTHAVDLTDPKTVDAICREWSPDLVFICSAWPHVDGCEKDPARSHLENVETVSHLMRSVSATTRLVFFSTDHVFDGTHSRYGPDDVKTPLSVYAQHKAEVEDRLLRRGNALIVRTSYVFGIEARRKNFVYRVVECCRLGETLSVPERQGGMPTWAPWLAEATVELAQQPTLGVAHLIGPEWLTKAQWAQRIAKKLCPSPLTLVETTASASGQVAPRPDRVLLTSSPSPLPHPPLEACLSLQQAALSGES